MENIDVFGMSNQEFKEKFYLLRCVNENFSVMICEIDSKNSQFSEFISNGNNSNMSLTDAFYQTYSVRILI
jgi:hypothetical protein